MSASPQTAESSPIVSTRVIGGRVVDRAGRGSRAPPDDRLALLDEPGRHLVEPFGMPRDEDQPQPRMGPPRHSIRGERGRFLAFHGTSRHEDHV